MTDATKSIPADFEPISYERWKAEAERSLKGASFDKRLVSRTLDGVEIQPYYGPGAQEPTADAAGFPGVAPFVRGALPVPREDGWELRQEFAHPDAAVSNAQILRDLDRGVSGVSLVLDRGFSAGGDEPSACGTPVRTAADALRLLDGVHLNMVGVQTNAGLNGLGALAALVHVARASGTATQDLNGDLGFDPIGQLVRDGSLPVSWEQVERLGAALARWCAANAPQLRPIEASGRVWHERGATEVQEIAWAVAGGVVWLRALMGQGLGVNEAARSISFTFAAGRDVFLEIAKLRAARQLWARVVSAAGGDSGAQAMRLHVRTSTATQTQRDPWVNMLRVTGQCFAAAVSGANSITTAAFDEALAIPQEFGRRIARNTQVILRDESHLAKVQDPAGGSYYLEHMTARFAEQAWSSLQAVERAGGLVAWLQAGGAAQALAAVNNERDRQIASRKLPITGVSEYPNLTEKPVDTPTAAAVAPARGQGEAVGLRAALAASGPLGADVVDAAIADFVAGADSGALLDAVRDLGGATQAEAIPALRYAAAWEALRDASDAALERTGSRPRLFLANLGTIPQHLARATFAQNLFQAGGIETIGNTGFSDHASLLEAFRQSGATLACICGSDALYEEQVAALAPQLKAAGATELFVAGRSPDHEAAWRAAGVDTFIFMGCDALGVLRSALSRLGLLG